MSPVAQPRSDLFSLSHTSGQWIDIARQKKIADPCVEPLHTLLGRARTQIPIPVRLKPMRAERVAEEVEAFLSGVSQRSFRLVDRQPEPGHHRLRPRQCLCRATAAEDNEVVGIGDDVSMERVAASGQTPVLQEPVLLAQDQLFGRPVHSMDFFTEINSAETRIAEPTDMLNPRRIRVIQNPEITLARAIVARSASTTSGPTKS